jgi:hypothetical protein
MASFEPETDKRDAWRRLVRWLLIGIGLVVIVVALVLLIQSGVQPASINTTPASDAELTETMVALSEEAEAFYVVSTALDSAFGGNLGMPFPETDPDLALATDVVGDGTATPPANP